MDAALTWAEEKDITEVTALTDGNRETNRFFARLGLATLGTVRHTSAAGLRKKLSRERAGVAAATATSSRYSPSGAPCDVARRGVARAHKQLSLRPVPGPPVGSTR